MVGSHTHTYKTQIYPAIKNLRGATRVANFLEEKAWDQLETVDESEAKPISELEWDNLIILDACRHDIYQEVRGYDVDYRITEGSHSTEFIEGNFSEGDWSDTRVITGNPFYMNFRKSKGHDFFSLTNKSTGKVFKDVVNLLLSGWNEINSTVMPENICQEALKASNDDQIILHFMQPHVPHIPASYSGKGYGPLEEGELTEMEKVRKGLIGLDEFQKGYRKNLSYVLNFVDLISDELEGKTVVTGDHGELLGENGFFGHPRGSNVEKLRKVPVEILSED